MDIFSTDNKLEKPVAFIGKTFAINLICLFCNKSSLSSSHLEIFSREFLSLFNAECDSMFSRLNCTSLVDKTEQCSMFSMRDATSERYLETAVGKLKA